MRRLFIILLVLLCSHVTYAQQKISLNLGPTCNVELKKYGVILPMPCDLKKDSTADGIMTFKKDYYVDGAMAGYVYITVSPNRYKSMEDVEKARAALLDTYRQNAEELGLVTKLSEIDRFRAPSETHLHLAARDSPELQGNPNFEYMYWIDLLLGKDYTVRYEMLAPYDSKVVMQLREMVRLVDWLPVTYKDAKSGLSMKMPGGDWKAGANSTGTGIQLKPHYLWENMYVNPRSKFPDVQVLPMPAYTAMGFDKALAEIKSKIQQRGGMVDEDEEVSFMNATKAGFITAQFNPSGKNYDKEYIWLLQLPGNKFVEVSMKATCDEYGCRGQYDILPMMEKVVLESLKY